MKIKLIAPKMSLRPMDSELKRLMTPSISLLVLSALTPSEHRMEIIDENLTPVINYRDADLVGITCNVDNFESAKEHSEKFRKNGIPVILGGIFPSSLPEIAAIHDREIMINASMVFGFDDDYPDVFKNTLIWLIKNRIETMTGHILTPYPGTKLYKRLEKEGRIIDRDFSHYNTSKVVFKPKNMSPDELLNGYLNIYKKFYSMKNILKRKPQSKSQWIPYFLFNLAYRKFGRFTSKFAMKGNMGRIGRLARNLSYGIG
jgi:radical SAM superfamily enzyme YgiQ (UPF0313 family)